MLDILHNDYTIFRYTDKTWNFINIFLPLFTFLFLIKTSNLTCEIRHLDTKHKRYIVRSHNTSVELKLHILSDPLL